ncbi:hypothetical protein, conserved [Trypanosoma cruzi]|uniref:Protein SirB1 N-terminal domain-containing protein n=1 Tax=Trypanosoma cruzi (strain CL Brener) TaxID=353153 RepID=Q4CYA9_TRYCC|nr:uncharacterized protein Tc00.1047053504443.20 [Trypanosoma cruzi]EAN85262.1 hypothetical protein, conserved [Trypanosoma cruzi]|eukprot:XP_807113.1 hypothetical protein Tc00.1047053504443.20 [Trypanosoma cruzi strain CL Brener]
MSARVARSMYRRMLKIVASIKRVGAEQLALERYAEFLPCTVEVRKGESLHALLRKAFISASLSAESLASGFSFIKDATESLPDLELLSLWNAYCLDGEYEMLYGVALLSAALQQAENEEPTHAGELGDIVSRIRGEVRLLVNEMKEAVAATPTPSSVGRHGLDGRPSSLETAVESLWKRGFDVSERAAEDLTALSLLRKRRASVFLLNVLLTVALHELGVPCTLVGTESHRPWIRVQKSGSRPLFMSFAHAGVHSAKEVLRLDGHPPTSTQWWRAARWDGSGRKHILSRMLKVQLMLLSSSLESPLRTRQLKTCRTQILFLLS